MNITYDSYRVEYVARDGRYKGRDFSTYSAAEEFYDSVGNADLLGFKKYMGYYFIARKG